MRVIITEHLRATGPLSPMRLYQCARVDLEKPGRIGMDVGAWADFHHRTIAPEQQAAGFAGMGGARLGQEALAQRA